MRSSKCSDWPIRDLNLELPVGYVWAGDDIAWIGEVSALVPGGGAAHTILDCDADQCDGDDGQDDLDIHLALFSVASFHEALMGSGTIVPDNNQLSVVIEPGASLVHTRMRAARDGLDQGEFTEGHELDRKWRVAKPMIGRRLSQEEAKRWLAKFG